MELAAANRRYDAIHQDRPFHDGKFQAWSDKPSPMTPYHFRDGVTITVAETDLHPDDRFLDAPGLSLPPGQPPETPAEPG